MDKIWKNSYLAFKALCLKWAIIVAMGYRELCTGLLENTFVVAFHESKSNIRVDRSYIVEQPCPSF